MASQISPKVERVIADSNAAKDVLNRVAEELENGDKNDKRMLREVASRINVLESMKDAANAKARALDRERIMLGQRIRTTCPDLVDDLHDVLTYLGKISETPGALSEDDVAYHDALKKKIPEFIRNISKQSPSESTSEAVPKSFVATTESSVTTSIPPDTEDVVSATSSSASVSEVSGYETAVTSKPTLCSSVEQATPTSSDKTERTQTNMST
ncbi:hypothetical protein QR680_013662 [Steinernema hermaphroditum]|uniref:Uncharacterized protein n=1 Tax=Steinernema hermaphroditum TaxID=289476 RepID=A0AA39I917_9BILA|nr:hypothetical protein QR680_013662 [Steinernema hermaphroditum]